MRGITNILFIVVLSVLSVACNRRTDVVVPKEAEFAVEVAKSYAKTNVLIERPIVQTAQFCDGVWRLELVSIYSKKNSLDCWRVWVSTNGQIVLADGPR